MAKKKFRSATSSICPFFQPPSFRYRKSFWAKLCGQSQNSRDLQKLHLLIKNPLAWAKRMDPLSISRHPVLESPFFCAAQLKLKLITSMTRTAVKRSNKLLAATQCYPSATAQGASCGPLATFKAKVHVELTVTALASMPNGNLLPGSPGQRSNHFEAFDAGSLS